MRVSSLILFTIWVVSIGLQSCQPPNGPADPGYDKINGITSATRRLYLDSVWVYHDRALVYWREYYELDADILAYRIEWGKNPTNFTDTLELRPYVNQTTMIDTIPNLEPSTSYYAQFYRDWNGTVKKDPFQFTTRAAPQEEGTPQP